VNPGKQLYDLQEIDLELDKKGAMLLHLESQLSHNQPLAEAKARLESKQKQLAEMQTKEREVEWAVEDFSAKLKPLQDKLYAGSVKNPKELSSLQQQVEQLKGQLSQEEDKALEIMGQVETVQREIAALSAEVKRMEEEWQRERERLLAEQAELKSAIDALGKRRDEIAATVELAHLELYEALRAKRQGYAVARIEQGRCQGCRITLSTSEMTRARVGGLVQCDSCSRVLYLG
jgi:predicted  nucleic acid-binding Zn-ribbon protein